MAERQGMKRSPDGALVRFPLDLELLKVRECLADRRAAVANMLLWAWVDSSALRFQRGVGPLDWGAAKESNSAVLALLLLIEVMLG